MWTRLDLKTRAKKVLSESYWKAFLVSLIIVMVGGGDGGGSSSSGTNYTVTNSQFDLERFLLIGSIIFIGVLLFIAFRIFLGFGLEVGSRKYFIRASEGNSNLNHIKFAFKSGHIGNVIVSMLYRSILLLLWFLCLIIPGIIKSYAYRFVPYLLADNPGISPSRAIELSKKMTDGQKMDMFVLDLSFIGWYILGGLALGIGILFVNPYRDTTYSELYLVLRDNLIKSGVCSADDLNLQSTSDPKDIESDNWESVFDRYDD